MINKKKYSFWIVGIIIFIIIVSLIPWEETLPLGPKIGVVEINKPIMDSKKIVLAFQ